VPGALRGARRPRRKCLSIIAKIGPVGFLRFGVMAYACKDRMSNTLEMLAGTRLPHRILKRASALTSLPTWDPHVGTIKRLAGNGKLRLWLL
jgi:hypothetical protein